MRVLLVEDNADLRRAIVRAIAPVHVVTVAIDGEEALDTLDNLAPGDRFDAIILDFNLPGVFGSQLLAAIERRTSTPVVWLTGVPHLVPGVRPRVVAKPAGILEILEALESAGDRPS